MKYKRLLLGILAASLVMSSQAFADPGGDDDDDGPQYVIVQNWQTFYPRVTSLRSLNAYLALNKGEKVFYVPTLEELPNVVNAVSDCTDYTGARQRFAAVYGGYFDQMCYEALVRKSDGTYSQVPAIVQTDGKNSVRELTTLGYDFLLSSEGLTGVQPNGEAIDATYSATKVDADYGFVDLNTALMDIYKAVGQSKYDILYAFTPDSTLTVENSPIQKELSLQLDTSRGIDTSAGNAWVFVTRTNPSLYWKQAAYDGVIWDGESLHNGDSSGSSNVKTERVSLAEFCMYAYNIMNIYGEPVMTQSEKNILLQLYGSVVPYKACTEAEVEAIETLIAKGIISPDDDSSKLQWNSDVDFEYMLTMLMRINDVNARKTYKDVQITLDASLLSNDYYNAKLEYESSNIVELKEARSAAQVTNYYDARLGVSQFESMMQTVSSGNVSSDLFIPTHLVIVGPDGTVFPLTTQVTTYTQKVYDKNSTADYVLKSYDPAVDGQLMQFCISDGIRTDETGKFLHIRIASFTVSDLLHSDGSYHLHLINDRGDISTSAFTIRPGGGIYYTSGVRSNDNEKEMLTDNDDEDSDELSNQDIIDELIQLYDEEGVHIATAKLREYEKANPQWTAKEVEAAEYAASNGDYLAASTTSVMYMRIRANSESNIMVTTKKGEVVKLSDIMSNDSGGDETHYADPKATDDLSFRKINSTVYQVNNCNGANDLNERVKSSSVEGTDTAFCKRDTQLLVSTKWLLEKGLITTNPLENGDLVMLSTTYSNIYLDKANQYVVVGACVYDVKDLDKSEIWLKTNDDLFVNFRAVLGWTGQYMIFKNVGGTISVSIQDSITVSASQKKMSSTTIKLMDIPKSAGAGVSGNDSTIDVFSPGNNKMVSMSAMYPLANYFVYINSHVLESGDEYHDWLFVFKPKDVQANGSKVSYDDTESRKTLRDTLNIKLDGLDENITVWAYPLYRQVTPDRGMPKGMSYTDENGYMYLPSKITSFSDVMASYWAGDNVLRADGTPDYVLPFYIDGNDSVRCFNFNTFTYKDSSGNDAMMDYGSAPGTVVAYGSSTNGMYTLATKSGIPDFQSAPDMSFEDSVMSPTVTSPALWFLELQKYDYKTVCASLNTGSALYWGTNRVNLTKSKTGEYTMMIGSTDITSNLEKMEYLLMRETAYSTSTIGRWFSVSALSAFKLDSVVEDGDGTKGELGPKSGKLDKTVDSIDWNEFKLTRLLENGEFAVSIATIIVVNVLPRVALCAFLLLTMLGVIQNVKIWQIFCDKFFDPYKFLTAGRRDVHTFMPGRAFITSIIAMAVYALFMDGTIIHVYEWIMQFIGAFLGS